MLKKIISLLLMLILLSTFMVVAYADGAPTIGVSTVEADPGETVNLTVYIQNNPGISSAKFYVLRDASLTLTNYAVGTVLGDASTGTSESALAKEYFVVSLKTLEGSSDDGTLCTLTYTVPDDAVPGSTLPVSVSKVNDKDGKMTVTNIAGQKIVNGNENLLGFEGFTLVTGGVSVKGTPAPTTYTVTYDAGEGTIAQSEATIIPDLVPGYVLTLITADKVTPPIGKKFKCWSEGTNEITGATYTVIMMLHLQPYMRISLKEM